MKKTLSLLLTLLVATTLVACSDGNGTAQVQVAGTNTTAAVSGTQTAAVVGAPFGYSNGVPVFGTTAPTTVVFSNTATTPAFSVTSGGNTATGTTTFGSCHFLVTSSTFISPPSPLVVGTTITADPCTIVVNNKGQLANGLCTQYTVQLLLGTRLSDGQPMSICLAENGDVSIGGIVIGKVTLVPLTGA
jgi:hypothetical protein